MIRYFDLKRINASFGDDLKAAINRAVNSGWYIKGSEVEQFENEFAAYVGTNYCIGVGNGLDALQLVEQLQPDLLLTDIQMPFITGTELAKSVRELQPLISIAFLSGYDDFEYAQRAIENRVISYLLKPISVAELTAALREIHVKMERNFQELRPVDVHISKHLTTASLLLDRGCGAPASGERHGFHQTL